MPSESSWVDFTAGWISGGISTLAIQPVDTILTRMQANASIVPSSPSSLTANRIASAAATDITAASSAAAVASLRPSNIFHGMISNFGVRSLWRGSSAMIGAVPIQNAVLMTGYGYGKRWTTGGADEDYYDEDFDNSTVFFGIFIGGCAGGILQSFVMSPIELIKISQQVKSVSAATTSAISGLLRCSNGNGYYSAWRGLGATLLRDGIPHGVWFVSYEYAKVELTAFTAKMRRGSKNVVEGIDDDENRSSSSSSTSATTNNTEDEIAIPMLSGAFAATTAWGVGYPFDLIKTRIQAGTSTGGIISTAKDIIKESSSLDGSRACYGLYRGFGLKLLRSIPASAIGFLVYENASKALSSRA